jgi:FMN reductase
MGGAAIIVGNPKARSRTLLVAECVMGAVVDCVGESIKPEVIDLADYARDLFDWESADLNELTAKVAQCDLIVAASPTYKATYTGLLKGFFDRYGNNGLAGVVVVPVMVGAAPIHALAPELLLRPLFVELGATVPSRALYVLESQIEQIDDVVGKWATAARPLVAAALSGRGSGGGSQ